QPHAMSSERRAGGPRRHAAAGAAHGRAPPPAAGAARPPPAPPPTPPGPGPHAPPPAPHPPPPANRPGSPPPTPPARRRTPPGREGLAGTTPANLYKRLDQDEYITIAPDGRPMAQQPAWRQDFPIDWPQDHYVERRDFMKFMVLTSAALAVGQFWIAAENWW